MSTPHKESTMVAYRVVAVGGMNIFYREAGPADAPAVLLLHSSEFLAYVP
jgi:pimeloyl-ACP methyl ester carboxylesterase